ncbi:hypothetical protein [Streptomyces sp. NPDC058394]|uniref:hypothetical protein n=1 Tax=Streptomyces sp. NPDC058394 TaxID=3346477 RepID=UPI003662B06A
MNQQGHKVARCTVERLMREPGMQGSARNRHVITTIPGGQVHRAPDLVAAAPNRCLVADFTHIRVWSATVYFAFVMNTLSHRIVNWSATTVKETVFVLDAPEMELWQRDRDQPPARTGKLRGAEEQHAGARRADLGVQVPKRTIYFSARPKSSRRPSARRPRPP